MARKIGIQVQYLGKQLILDMIHNFILPIFSVKYTKIYGEI